MYTILSEVTRYLNCYCYDYNFYIYLFIMDQSNAIYHIYIVIYCTPKEHDISIVILITMLSYYDYKNCSKCFCIYIYLLIYYGSYL